MDLGEAVDKASRVLTEERVRPTVEYYDPVMDWISSSHKATIPGLPKPDTPANVRELVLNRQGRSCQSRLNLHTERGMRPRPVHQYPDEYVFRSENFEMLVVLYTQLQESERPALIASMLKRIPLEKTYKDSGKQAGFPSYNRNMSELPLLAEFVIRMGHRKDLVDAINAVEKPTVGLVTLFLQLEDMLALNFTLFSDSELDTFATDLTPFWRRCGNIELEARKQTFAGQHAKEGVRELGMIAREICQSVGGIAEQCRTARHHYLREQLLQQSPNLEIESDKRKVESFLVKLGFRSEMVGALNAAESDYTATANSFELKSCLGHLRSFLEHLHRGAANSIASKAGEVIKDKWGDATAYLSQSGYITKQHSDFVTSLYTLMSDTSVHPLGAEREYARLLRNVVIEYGVMFLTALDKRGVTI